MVGALAARCRQAGAAHRITRRTFGPLAFGAALACVGGPGFAATAVHAPVRRAIALDWAAAETLAAMGRPPIAVAELPSYARAIVAPSMPPDVIDVGLRLEPNLELMQSLQPDLILINPAEATLRTVLAPLAPIQIVSIYGEAGSPLDRAREVTNTLARLVDAKPGADALLEQLDAAMAKARQRLRVYDGRPLYVIGFIDEQHVAVATRGSLFQGVLDLLGLRNAWQGEANSWGATVVGVESLLPAPEARLAYLTPWTGDLRMAVTYSQLWKRLPFVQAGRVVGLPPVFPFGALPSAMRFAELLSGALTQPIGQRESRLSAISNSGPKP